MTGKMKNFLIILFVVFCFSACRNIERTERPDDLIGEEKMVDVLTELAILQSARNVNKTILEDVGIKPYEYIYEKHNIDSLQFERSSNYYTENFTAFENIFERVRDRLQRMKEARDSIQEEEERIQDSILKLNPEVRDSIRAQDSIRDLYDKRRRDFMARDSIIPSGVKVRTRD